MKKSDEAYNYIKKAIITKEYFPGNRIVEEDVVKRTNVSRTSVRKALAQLEYEGLVDSTSGQGVIVTRYSMEDIKSIFAVREALEIGAFKLAMDNITGEAIERMRKENREIKELSKNFSIDEYVKHNKAFHSEIAKASKNKYFEKYLMEVLEKIAVSLLFYNNVLDDERSIDYHNEIIEALCKKDFKLGSEAIRKDNDCAKEDANFFGV